MTVSFYGARKGRVFSTFRFGAAAVANGKVRDPGRRTTGLVIGAVGIAGIGLGAVSAIVATILSGNERSECPSASSCNFAAATNDYNAARVWAHVSEIGFGTGAAGLVVGGVLFFTAPWVTPGKMGLGLSFGAKF